MRILLGLTLALGCSNSSNNNNANGCPSPFMLCSSTCTATQIDPANCGTCGKACAAGDQCTAGACVAPGCPTGSMKCGTSCVATDTDNANCGTCSKKCDAGQVCSAGSCSATCASGYATCTGYCADTANDSQNCGACGTVCPAGQRCASSKCSDSCGGGASACNGKCVDLMSDAANCGACGTACPTGEACVGGSCNCGWSTLTLGRLQVCGLRGDGTVVCAGSTDSPNGAGSNVGGISFSSLPPAPIAGLSSVKAIDGGDGYLCALKTDGTVWCMGNNLSSRLGNGASPIPTPEPTPAPVRDSPTTVLSSVSQISCGSMHSCALKTNGEIWCWGNGANLGLGNGSGSDHVFAIQATLPAGLTGVKKVVAGAQHTCAINGDNTVWCWGLNNQGQLGSGDAISPVATPQPVVGLSDVSDVVTEYNHVCAIKSDKSLWCWGNDTLGQVGVTATLAVRLPSPVPIANVAEVGVGTTHTCARKTDGTVWCWGRNARGELGNGTIDDPESNNNNNDRGNPSPTPQPVVTADGTPLVAKSIAVSHGHSCAVVGVSDHPFCWGNNLKGQSALTTRYGVSATPIYSCGR